MSPIYKYKCNNCGEFEVNQKMDDDSLQKCPKCGNKVKKLVSWNGNFSLKGDGWPSKDYRKNK